MYKGIRAGLFVLIGIDASFLASTFHGTIRLHSESAGCSWTDVIRARRYGLNPVDPEVEKRLKVVGADGDLRLVASPLGNFWIQKNDVETLGSMVSEQQGGVYDIDGHGVHSGDIVLDCGANIGVYTRRALLLGAKQVVAIEPAPDTVECLRRNFAAEIAAGKVIVCPKGVWNQESELKLYRNDKAWSDSFVAEGRSDKNAISVPLTTVDLLVRDLKLERVDFIKMDIEGAERKALQGARETVSRFHPRLAIALEHLTGDAEGLPAFIRELWPEMHTRCGPCAMEQPSGKFRVQPQAVVAY